MHAAIGELGSGTRRLKEMGSRTRTGRTVAALTKRRAEGAADGLRLNYTRHLHPEPYTLHPEPYTLNPTHHILNPTHYTLNPTHYIQIAQPGIRQLVG